MKGKMRWRTVVAPIRHIELKDGHIWFTASFPRQGWMKPGSYPFSIIGSDGKRIVQVVTAFDDPIDRHARTIIIELPVRLHSFLSVGSGNKPPHQPFSE